LHQNFPNPFNPNTVISYELAIIGHVSINVYDVLGKNVATLIDKKQNAGNYELKFDGSNLPGGLYFNTLIL